jgi:hypothetical protein
MEFYIVTFLNKLRKIQFSRAPFAEFEMFRFGETRIFCPIVKWSIVCLPFLRIDESDEGANRTGDRIPREIGRTDAQAPGFQ